MVRVRQPAAPPANRPLRSSEILAARRRARDRSLRRNGALLGLAVLALLVVWPLRMTANPDLPAAEALAARVEAVYRAVRAGDLGIEADPREVAEGVTGVRVPSAQGDRWVVAGAAGGDCYSMWWDEAGLRRIRRVPPDIGCEPSIRLTSSHPLTWERVAPAAGETERTAAWDAVLPDAETQRAWFLPAVVALAGFGLARWCGRASRC